VATVDDFAFFAAMLRGGGAFRGARVLSRASVSLMTADQLTPAVKACSGLLPGDFDDAGWGFGVGVVTRRTGLARSAGSYGWDGGLGTSWLVDPAHDLTVIVLTQRMFETSDLPQVHRDIRAAAYAALA
jgi:CubicO group peptidase (beta-lactamase class C family)